MTEGAGVGPEMMRAAAPEYIGAVFQQGRSKNLVYDIYTREVLVPAYDVLKKEERESWMFENFRVFLDGTVSNPEAKWKGIIDFWLSELKFAANRAGLGRQELRETEDDLKAIMAVCSSARAMEVSAGTASTYLTFVTQSEGGRNLDVQDTWRDFLLHDDEYKLRRVIGTLEEPSTKPARAKPPINELIEYYYYKLVQDAGIELGKAPDVKLESDGITIKKIDTKVAGKGDLIDFLSHTNPYLIAFPGENENERKEKEEKASNWKRRESFDDYIEEKLLSADEGKDLLGDYKKQESEEENVFKHKRHSRRWTAAKIACDAFLVNLFTQWEDKLSFDLQAFARGRSEEDKKSAKKFQLKPVPTWGGDPFRSVLRPSFLPRVIKETYESDTDSVIHDLTDLGFRPEDVCVDDKVDPEIRSEIEKKLLVPSATAHLKAYARYENALWAFFGESSRASGIPQWTKDTMGKHLPAIVEYLDQVYGTISTKEVPNLGKHLLGLMITRLIHGKALAVTLESARPGFVGNLATLFGDPKERPFLEVRQFLYGPLLDGKEGFFTGIAGARTRFVLGGKSIFNEEINSRWQDIWELLLSNDQTPEGRKKQRTLNYLGFVLDTLSAVSETRRKR